jgi:hypothetical protein
MVRDADRRDLTFDAHPFVLLAVADVGHGGSIGALINARSGGG